MFNNVANIPMNLRSFLMTNKLFSGQFRLKLIQTARTVNWPFIRSHVCGTLQFIVRTNFILVIYDFVNLDPNFFINEIYATFEHSFYLVVEYMQKF